MLNRYMQYFLDPVERYSYYLTQAAIASAKNDDRRSIELLNKIDVKTLNSAEKTRLELLRARYFTRLGDHKKALQIIEHLSDPSDEYSPQISLIRAVSAEFEGDLTRSSEILFDAIESASDRLKNADYFCVLNNYGRIQKIIKNETESLTHYRKALKLAKDLNEKHLMHVAYQNVIPSLVSAHRQDEARQFISKYRSIVDFANPDDLVEYYNFLIEFYREANNRNKLFETIDEARERVYPFVSRKEQVVCDISQHENEMERGSVSTRFPLSDRRSISRICRVVYSGTVPMLHGVTSCPTAIEGRWTFDIVSRGSF
jgi:tetratricopeptide (TPR) repeat protein